jgi:hypothetical protein
MAASQVDEGRRDYAQADKIGQAMSAKSPQTTLNLLTREGAVTVTFPVELTEDQYAKLYAFVVDAQTRQELKDCLAMVANEWGIKAVIDDG